MLHQELSILIQKLCDADERRKELLEQNKVPVELIMTQLYEPDIIYLTGYGLANKQ